MRIGIIVLPEQDWQTDRERWVRAEELGFDHAWIYDHLAWRTLADGPWHATVPTLTAAALATTRIGLGTLVTSPNYRHPVTLAKDLMTIDVMSQGRLLVGMGAGGTGFDATVLGAEVLSARERFERFVEFRALLGELLENRLTTWRGEWFEAVEARMVPGPAQQPRPPLLVAAEGPKGMRLAVERASRPGDGWVTVGHLGGSSIPDEEWFAAVRTSVDRMAAVEARPPEGFVRMLNMESRIATASSVAHLEDQIGQAADLGFTDVTLAWPRRTEPYLAPESLLDELAAALPRLQAL